MTDANPYAPPRATVADVDEDSSEVEPVRTWSGQGRIGRLRYLAHLLVAYIVLFVFMFVGGFLLAVVGLDAGVAFLSIAGIAVYLWFTLLKTVQRSHDMGWSGWTAPLVLIPLVNLVWIFNPGTRGRNRFGAPPPPNTLGVKILGLALPVLFTVGMLAAIALPAYQDYKNRARAVQQR